MAAIRYTDAGQMVVADRREVLPSGFEGMIGGVYTYIGHPERWVEWCRAQLATRSRHSSTSGLAWFSRLCTPVRGEEAMGVASGLVEAAEATANPFMLSFALFAYGLRLPRGGPRPRS